MEMQVLTADPDSRSDCGFRLSPDVACVVMADRSARVLDMTDRFYSIPRSATMILQEVLDGGVDSAAKRLADTFQIDEEKARTDVERFVEQFVAKGMLRRTGEMTRQSRSFFAGLMAILIKAAVTILPTLGSKAFVILTLARFSCAACGWTATVEAWRRRFRKPNSDTLQESDRRHIANIESTVARRAARHVLGMDCKERSLACWALTRFAGLPASIVIGADFYPIGGHAWCEADSRIISDDPANCRRYLRLLSYA